MKVLKNIAFATVFYLIALLLDYIITLFSIEETGMYSSFFGIRIDMTFTEAEISTVFALTSKVALAYVIFVAVYLGGAGILSLVKRRSSSHSVS